MKFFLISDNIDTLMGMRLSGIEGVVVHEKHEVKEALNNALKDSEIAVILITQKLITESSELVYDLKLNRKYPLIVEIPDRHGSSHISTSISQYVREAIGIRI
ncbi:MAG: V-type ATP synthase subunit F [Oscillospiraceae bacterium]|nr:V-type ATP synthase subunit F [Oscillospiraceae bacterium]MBQ5990142.1 V-type ATP synthase subunit F [Oscillospiraceae bacterium]